MNAPTFDDALNTVMELPIEQQEMLLHILRQRQIQRRRAEIASDAQESLILFRAGKLGWKTADSLIQELRTAADRVSSKRLAKWGSTSISYRLVHIN